MFFSRPSTEINSRPAPEEKRGAEIRPIERVLTADQQLCAHAAIAGPINHPPSSVRVLMIFYFRSERTLVLELCFYLFLNFFLYLQYTLVFRAVRTLGAQQNDSEVMCSRCERDDGDEVEAHTSSEKTNPFNANDPNTSVTWW